MSKHEPTIDELLGRFKGDVKSTFYGFLVFSILSRLGKASSKEIKQELVKTAGQDIEYNYTSYYRLISRLEKTYGLIEPVDVVKDKGPARVYYALTPKGKELYKRALKEVVVPLKAILPTE